MSTIAESPTGTLFDISRGCFEDGPGLRTVAFLKGCSLDCPWCHNPEGKSFAAEVAFDAARCLGCGQCEQVCPHAGRRPPEGWRSLCDGCGRCADVCPGRARRLAGITLAVDELVSELLVDQDFFAGTGGGVTFSGGEPLSQARFLFAAARQLREAGVHVALETAGCWPARHVDEIAEHFDLVLFDLKHVRVDRLRQLAQAAGSEMLDNLQRLLEAQVPLELRLTLVPGFNDGEQDLRAISSWLRDRRHVPPLRIHPFHRMASSKQQLFGRPYPCADLSPPSADDLDRAAQFLNADAVLAVSRW